MSQPRRARWRESAWVKILAGVALAAAGYGIQRQVRTQVAAVPIAEVVPLQTALAHRARSGLVAAGGADVPASAINTADYKLLARVDPETHVVMGSGEITFINRSSAPLNELYVHLYLNAFADDQSAYRRIADSGFRGGNKPTTPGSTHVTHFAMGNASQGFGHNLWETATPATDDGDRTDYRVPLPTAIQPGQRVSFRMEFESNLPSVVARSGFYERFHFVAQWFPKLARLEEDGTWAHFPYTRFGEFYADYGSYDVTVEAPPDFTVVGAGTASKPTKNKGGDNVWRFEIEPAHDFAFAVWDGFEHLSQVTPAGVTIDHYFPAGMAGAATREVEAAAFGLQHFSKRFGSYPYSSLRIVHPPRGAGQAGGMEYPGLITTGANPKMRHLGSRYDQLLTLHELGHQWFYGLLGSNEHADPFLDEGLTMFAELDAAVAWHPGESAFAAQELRIELTGILRAMYLPVAGHAPIGRPADGFASGSDYGGLVYGGTVTLLESLARVYGRTRVLAALKSYAHTYRFRHPRREDLVTEFRAHVGDGCADALVAGIEQPFRMDYAFVSTAARRGEEDDSPYRGLVTIRKEGPLQLPVEVELRFADGERERHRWDGKSDYHRVHYVHATRLVGAIVDPERRLLIDVDWTNNYWRSGPPAPANRSHAVLGAFAGLFLGAVAP